MSLLHAAPVATSPLGALPQFHGAFIVMPVLVGRAVVGAVDTGGGAVADVAGVTIGFSLKRPRGGGGSSVLAQSVALRILPAGVRVFLNTNRFLHLVTHPDGAGQYLVEMGTTRDGNSVKSGGMGMAIAEVPVSAVPVGGVAVMKEAVLRFSDRFRVGSPFDSRHPNAEFEDRVYSPLSMDRIMPVIPEDNRRVQRQAGFIELDNTDGALDPVIRGYPVGGSNVRVLFGPYGGAYSDFQLVGNVLGVRFEQIRGNIRLVVRDRSSALQLPLQENTYTGTGGTEGGQALKGKSKPLVFGEVYNVPLVQVDALHLVYQLHDGAMEAVVTLRDRGTRLVPDRNVAASGDVETYAALKAATISAGHYITCLALGLVRLGSSPAGLLTADAKGDKTGGVYADRIGPLALRIILDRGAVSPEQVDEASWRGLPDYRTGLFMPSSQRMSSAQAVDELVSAIAASWGTSRGGVVRVYQHNDPAQVEAVFFLGEEDIIAMRLVHTMAPRWRQKVGYRRNNTVQDNSALAGSVSRQDRAFLSNDYQIETRIDMDVRKRHADAADPPVLETGLVSHRDAETVASHLIRLHGADRSEYEITLKRIGWLVDLGQVIGVRYGRFGFENGKNVLVRRIRENARREEIILTVWG